MENFIFIGGAFLVVCLVIAGFLRTNDGPVEAMSKIDPHIEELETHLAAPIQQVRLRSRTSNSTYPVLRFVAGCFRILGWLLVAAAAVELFVILTDLATSHSINNGALLWFLTGPFLLGLLLSTVLLALGCIGYAEILRLFIDMSLNTALVAEILQRSEVLNRNPMYRT
jgi:hypothetical protein